MPFSSKCVRSAHEQHHNHPNTPQLVGKADSQDPPLPPVLLNQNTMNDTVINDVRSHAQKDATFINKRTGISNIICFTKSEPYLLETKRVCLPSIVLSQGLLRVEACQERHLVVA